MFDDPALLDGGEIRAVAPLARRHRAGIVQVRCMGHTGLDHSPIVSRTGDHAATLANHLASELRRLAWPWTLDLVRLPSDSAFAAALTRQLRVSEVRSDALHPIVEFDRADARGPVLSRNLRQAEAKARNRIRRADLTLHIRWITDQRTIASRTSEIRSTHRARDFQLRGASLLDDRQDGRYYDTLLRKHLDLLDLLEVRLEGELAAYLLWIRNGPTRLVFDNRVAPRWTNYSAGVIANNVALRLAAEDPSITVLDWGSGLQRYKLQSANKVIAHDRLLAWSSNATRRALAAHSALVALAGRQPAGVSAF